MLRSMTAFGRSTLPVAGGELLCEIRSVNHRYLDITIRLPEALRTIETGIREQLSARLQRGKVEAVLKFNETSATGQAISINEVLLAELLAAADKLEAQTKSACVIDSIRLLQWPGVVDVNSKACAQQEAQAQEAFAQALQDFVATRKREGEQMASMLSHRNEQLATLVEQLRQQRPAVLERQREKLQARLATLSEGHDEARLEQELVYAAQRLDIDEELDRLAAHSQELSLVLQRDEPVGRRLDFLMQEFNRETNTISSKSADQQTTALALDMKVLIEQMREQIQNVE